MFEICSKCLMPNTRPDTPFDKNVCQACKNFDLRKDVNWDNRLGELKEICDRHRSRDGSWDCFIPVSGGKDSYAIIYWVKVVMKMNPLLITVGDPFTATHAGTKNYSNMGDVFNCDQILATVSPDLVRRLTKSSFEKYLDPLCFLEQVLNAIPFKYGSKLGISLSFKGESPFVHGAPTKENKSALEYILGLTKQLKDVEYWIKYGAKKEELNSIMPLSEMELNALNPECYYMSYFIPWSSISNWEVAKKYGFGDLTHEWKREGCIEDFEQIDSVAYLTHLWLKYPKYGFQRTSDIASRRIREGSMSINEAKKLITKYDHRLDQLALNDFINFLGISIPEFWNVVEKFWNPDIFEKDVVSWKMKVPRFPI